jgi:hypothetical protein
MGIKLQDPMALSSGGETNRMAISQSKMQTS